jgi:hypothetical protein
MITILPFYPTVCEFAYLQTALPDFKSVKHVWHGFVQSHSNQLLLLCSTQIANATLQKFDSRVGDV